MIWPWEMQINQEQSTFRSEYTRYGASFRHGKPAQRANRPGGAEILWPEVRTRLPRLPEIGAPTDPERKGMAEGRDLDPARAFIAVPPVAKDLISCWFRAPPNRVGGLHGRKEPVKVGWLGSAD